MKKLSTIIFLSMSFILINIDAHANHCSGGHKEINDSKDTSSEESKESKEVKSN
ncbi:MAG: hypothetical protein ACJ0GH_01840 [Alphaproteobacteria bacterium]